MKALSFVEFLGVAKFHRVYLAQGHISMGACVHAGTGFDRKCPQGESVLGVDPFYSLVFF